MGTSSGIQAGVMWTIVAGIQSFIKDRWKIDPAASVVLTGGDGQVLQLLIGLLSWHLLAKRNRQPVYRKQYVYGWTLLFYPVPAFQGRKE